MTVAEFVRALRSRWFVAALGVVASVAFAVLATTPRPLFWTQTDVLFVAPGASGSGVFDDSTRDGLTAFVSMVERDVNGGTVTRLSSPTATIYGAGIRTGYSVVLPNLGNQWQNSFARPVLSLQVVDEDPEEVQRVRAEALQRIYDSADRLQADVGVDPDSYITVEPVTPDPVISYVGTSGAGRMRALAVLTGLGVAVTAVVVVEFDRAILRRREWAGRAPALASH